MFCESLAHKTETCHPKGNHTIKRDKVQPCAHACASVLRRHASCLQQEIHNRNV